MFYLNNLENDFFTPIVLIAIIAVIILFLTFVGCLILANLKEKKNFFMDFNTREYTYNYEKGLFYFFDQKNIAVQKTYTAHEFYSQYASVDANRMKVWIQDVVTKDDYSPFIQADVKLKRKGKIYTSMVEVLSVNRKKNVIHFQSHLLPYMGSVSTIAKKKTKKKNVSKYILENEEKAQDFLSSGKQVEIIGIYYLKIYRSTDRVRADEKAYLKNIFSNAINSISHFFSKSSKYYKVSDTEIVIIDKEAISKAMVMNIGTSINTHIQQYLNFNVRDADLYVAIGVTSGSNCERKFDLAIQQSRQMANAIASNYTNEKILLYDPNFFDKYNLEQKNLEDIAMVCRNATFRVYFNATFNLKTREQSFYVVKAVPYGTEVSDFKDVLSLANKTSYGAIPLIKALNEKCKKALVGRKNTGVMIQMNLNLLKSFLLAMEEEKNSLNWIIAIPENDLIAQMNHLNTLRQTLRTVIDSGYKIALILYHQNSPLPSSLLRHFSYLVINNEFAKSLTDSKTQNSLKMIETNYALFPGLLTYIDLKDSNDFQLAAHSGAKILECEELSQTSSKPGDIDQEKLKSMLTKSDTLITSKSKNDFIRIEKLLKQRLK